MRYLLGALAFIFSFYALVLVTLNNQSTAVDLLYLEATEMTFGLALVISVSIGMVIGFVIAIFFFKVYQNSQDVKRLQKENSGLKGKLEGANKKIEAQSKTLNVVEDTLNAAEKKLKADKPKPKPAPPPPKKRQIKIFGYIITWIHK